MTGEGLDALVAAASKSDHAALKRLLALFSSKGTPGKENGSLKQLKVAALQCFKAAQAKLAEPSSAGDPGSVAHYASLGQASLAALEAQSSGTASTQLLPMRYNFVKRLVASGSYGAAWQEASILQSQLGGQEAPRTAEVASIAVGAVLMLLLCCAEGQGLFRDKLTASLHAVRGLDPWLGMLQYVEAEKHRDTVFKYLYKAAAQLLARKEWDQVAGVAATMAAIATSEQHLQRAVQATLKFAAHMPDGVVVDTIAAVVAALLSGGGPLPDSLALDALSMLCAAWQRSMPPAAVSSLWETVQQCCDSPSAVLQQAALLLPCLVIHQGAASADATSSWVQLVALTTSAAAASAAALQHHLAGSSVLSLAELQQCASVLAAAFQPCNLLRKALAQQEPEAAQGLLGDSEGVAAAAAQLELLGVLISMAHALAAAAALEGVALPAQLAVMARQGHAAAVGLATAAKLRAACTECFGAPVVDAGALAAVLGWDFATYCSSGGPLPTGGPLSGQELSWLVSALYNVGVDLHSDGRFEAAIAPLLAATSASICCLMEAITEGSCEQAVYQRAQDVAKRCSALSDAQLRAGDTAAAASSLGHAVAAMVQFGLGASNWQELLSSLAKLTLDALLSECEQVDAAGVAPPAPTPKARGARSGKAASSRSKGEAPASNSSTGSRDSGAGLTRLSCSRMILVHRQQVPAAARAVVGEQELHSWASLANSSNGGGSDGVAAARCMQLCTFLLADAFPAEQFPAEHARILLAAYQAGLAAGGLTGTQLLTRAVAVLENAAQVGADALALAGRARGLLCLVAAQQLVEQSMLDQREQRQQSHAAASTSSPGTAGAVAEGDGLPSAIDWEAWALVASRAEAAVQRLEAAMAYTSGQQELLPKGREALGLAAELGYMAALQGNEQLEGRCQQLCLAVLSSQQLSNGGGLEQWAAITPAGVWLLSCLTPGLRPAIAQFVPQLAPSLEVWQGSLAALYSAFGGEQPDLATLQSCLAKLAAGPRHAINALPRACLHRLMAEQEAGAGNVVSALYHATEAHRLVFNTAPASQAQPSAVLGTASAASPVGWWQLAAEQLCSLMQLGRLFELSGMADEALHALKEGLRMAVSMGAPHLAAAFRIQLAGIFGKQGSAAAAQHALGPARDLLLEMAGSRKASASLLILLGVQLRVVEARLSLATSDSATAWEHCQAAASLSSEAAAEGAGTDPWLTCQITAARASALLVGAECRAAQGDSPAAVQLATEALEAFGSEAALCSGGSSSSLEQRVAALMFLVLHQPSPPASSQQEAVCIWGLQWDAVPPDDILLENRPSAARGAAAKKHAGRATRSKAAASNEAGEESRSSSVSSRVQRLWRVYWLTREIPHLNRVAAGHLASECGRAGHLHLAALLLHTSLGATLRQQYRLVLHTKLQQLGVGRLEAAASAEEQQRALHAALGQLGEPLDERLVLQLAGLDAAAEGMQPLPLQPAQGRRRVAAQPQTQLALLGKLELEAQAVLQGWLAALPEGTVVCSLSTQPASSSGSSLSPAGRDGRLVLSRLSAGSLPIVLQLPLAEAAAGHRQHPIKALSLDPEDAAGVGSGSCGGAHSLVEGMLCLLEESGRSMKDMATDTREQQREWWRARLELDDRLAALLEGLDKSWLSCWRCLLMGAGPDQEEHLQVAEGIVQQLEAHMAQAGGSALSRQQLATAHVVMASLLQGSSALGGSDVQEACWQLCSSLGLDATQEQVAALLQLGRTSGACAGQTELEGPMHAGMPKGRAAIASIALAPQGCLSLADGEERLPEASRSNQSRNSSGLAANMAPARRKRAGAAKAVSFEVEEPQEPPLQQQQQPARGRRAATRGAKAAMSVAEPEVSCSSPPPANKGEAPNGLCEAFDAMSLQQLQQPQQDAKKPAAATTARASKHRSRLRMMQGSTPGPAASNSRAPGEDATSKVKGAATAPRLRGSSAAAAAQVARGAGEGVGAASGAGAEAPRGPVVLVLDGELQVLPWESTPGLRDQRFYRIPSLPCAAASAQRSLRSVDLASTFYSLNPSGDLSSTQSAFQDWFARLRWEGKAGQPPTATELAAALQSHQLFVYFGHGSGEQYIPTGKLRSLDSCSAALLMGCSSGRLRRRRHYEPTGPVLAYLLAGCPTAVANLWDVTDKDIDRFSHALLNTWLESGGGGGSAGPGLPTPTKADISGAVAGSRAACKLAHLIGAAPVCYGVPTTVQHGTGPGPC